MNDTTIENAVIIYFLTIIKKRKLYLTFRKSLRYGNFLGCKSKNRVDDDMEKGDLRNSRNLQDLALRIKALNQNMKNHMRNPNDKYEYIEMSINHLLHFFLERHVSMETIPIIGLEIYNMTCGALYGDDFSAEAQQEIDLQSARDIVMLKSMLHQNYVNAYQSGTISCSFTDYLRYNSSNIEQWMNANNVHGEKEHNFIYDGNTNENFQGMPMSDDYFEENQNENWDEYEDEEGNEDEYDDGYYDV